MRFRTRWLLVCVLCASCAAAPEAREDAEMPEAVSSCEEGCEDERSVILLCAKDLRTWFEQQGVQNIHDFTMVIPEHIHQRIHGGGARGGRWNQAWREYKEKNPFASPAEIYRYSGELIFRFELAGPLLPYRRSQ